MVVYVGNTVLKTAYLIKIDEKDVSLNKTIYYNYLEMRENKEILLERYQDSYYQLGVPKDEK